MKKLLILLFAVMCAVVSAQNKVPQSINYQTLIRNTDGTYLANTNLSLRVSIIKGNPTGTAVYTETHAVSTSKYGQVNVKIGEGSTNNVFSTIDWGSDSYFVKCEMALSGGSYKEVGVTPFSSVPYALCAGSAKTPTGTGILSFDADAPSGFGFSGNTITTTKTVGHWTTMAPMGVERRYVAVASVNNKIYVFGGETNFDFASTSVEVYDVTTNMWSSLTTVLPVGLTLGAAAELGGKIYIAGGIAKGTSVGSNTVHVYDPDLNSWATVASLNNGRYTNSLVAYNGKLYAIGGTNSTSSSTVVTAIEEYDLSANKWTVLTNIPNALGSSIATILNGKIYIVSGSTTIGDASKVRSTVLAYDITLNTWEDKAPILESRIGHTVSVVDGKIIAVGGSGINGYIASTEMYNELTNTWQKTENISKANMALRSTVVGEVLYIVGGLNDMSGSITKVNTVEKMSLSNQEQKMYIHTSN